MKLRKILLILICLFAILQTSFGQEKPQAILIDKFGKIINDDLLARFDSFYFSIYDTNSKGYVIVHGTKDDPLTKYTFERHIKGCFRMGKRSDENFIFALAEDRDKFEVEIWKVPNGAEKPQFIDMPRDYKLDELTKPRIVHKLNIADEYCPLFFDMEFYSKFLKANPNIIGKIIIYEKSLKNYQRERLKYLRDLTKTNGVALQQISFVRGKYYGETDAEFWLVPQSKK